MQSLQNYKKRVVVPTLFHSSSLIHVIDLALVVDLALVASKVFCIYALVRTTEVSQLQIKHDCLALQLHSATSECATWLALARERAFDSTNLRALLNTSKDGSTLIKGQIAVIQKEKEVQCFQETRM